MYLEQVINNIHIDCLRPEGKWHCYSPACRPRWQTLHLELHQASLYIQTNSEWVA